MVEDLLKSGELPCLVATCSLELGHRHGRGGPGDPGRVAQVGHRRAAADRPRRPRRRARSRAGASSPSSAPTCSSAPWWRSACATATSSRPWCRATRSTCSPSRSSRWPRPATTGRCRSCTTWSGAPTPSPSSRASCSTACSTCSTAATRPRSSPSCGRASSGTAWRTRSGRARARSSWRSPTRARSPTAASTACTCPTAAAWASWTRRWSTRRGRARRSCSAPRTWRIEEITRDRVIVTPAPGAPGAVPFWKGDGIGRPERARARRSASSRARPWTASPRSWPADYDLDERAARNLSRLPARAARRHARGAVRPHDRGRALPRRDRRLAAVRAVARSAAACTRPGRWRCRRASATSSASSPTRSGRTTGSSSTCPTPTSRRRPSSCWSSPTSSRTWWCASCAARRCSARASARTPPARCCSRAPTPGKRTPLWQQRLKAQSLLEVAKRYGQFPIVLETYRECLRDVLDLPGLEELLRGLHTRELSLVEVETQRASPFASSLLFDYVATYMYEGDTPNAERRAAALSLDRDLLRELLGQEELRELIDPDALAEVEADLQRLSERTRAANADGLHDVLRALGDLTADEAQARCLDGGVGRAHARASSRSERRAVRMRIGGEERWIAAEDAGLYRDALGAVPPGGLPEAFLEPVEEPLARLARRYARTHGPFTTARGRGALRRRPGPGAARARARRRAGARRAAPRRQRARVVRPGGAAPPAARLARVAAQGGRAGRAARARALPARLAGRRRARRPAAPASTGCARCSCRSRAWRWRPRCGSATCCRAAWARYSPAWLDQLCAGGELVWVGAGALGRGARGRVALYFREDAPLARPAADPRASRPPSRCTTRSASGSRRGAAFWTDLLADLAEPSRPSCRRRSGTWSGPARSTNDAFAPLRAPRLSRRAAAAATPAAASAPAPPPGRAAGPGPLVAHRRRCSPTRRRTDRACARSPRCCWSATGSSRARPCWPRASPAASPAFTASSRTSRRSAPRAAATSWRGSAAPSSRCRPRSSGCAGCAPTSRPGRSCWRRPTPPTRTAPRCPGPSATTTRAAGPRACRARTW